MNIKSPSAANSLSCCQTCAAVGSPLGHVITGCFSGVQAQSTDPFFKIRTNSASGPQRRRQYVFRLFRHTAKPLVNKLDALTSKLGGRRELTGYVG